MATDSFALVRAKLCDDVGFKKRAGDIYTLDLSDEVIGWLGLNRLSRYYPRGQFQLNPVVGVRHQEVERRIAKLRQRKQHDYLPPTISRQLGYVTPEARFRGWVMGPEAPASETEEFMTAITTYGLAFMRAHTDLETMLAEIDRGHALYSEYTRPVLLQMLGREPEALQDIEAFVQARAEERSEAAKDFRAFAAAFRAAVGA